MEGEECKSVQKHVTQISGFNSILRSSSQHARLIRQLKLLQQGQYGLLFKCIPES